MQPRIVLFAASFYSFHVLGQGPAIEWQRSFGGSGIDRAEASTILADGGYAVVGQSGSSDGDVTGMQGAGDVWVVSVDESGDLQGQATFGGSELEVGYGIDVTDDGGRVVTGFTSSEDGDVSGSHGSTEMWLLKLDADDNLQWQRCFGGSNPDGSRAVQQTADGGIVAMGSTFSSDGDLEEGFGAYDFLLVKFDATGAPTWYRRYGGPGFEQAYCGQQTSDGGYVLAGTCTANGGQVTGYNGGDYDAWVVKVAANGDLEWQKTLGGSGFDKANAIVQAADGGYVIACESESDDGDISGHIGGDFWSDYWVVKLDADGELLWERSLGGTDDDRARAVLQMSDGGFVVGGSTFSFDGDVTSNHGDADSWVVKLNGDGLVQWQKAIGGSAGDGIHSMRETADGGLICVGASSSNDGDVSGNHGGLDVFVVKLATDPAGIGEAEGENKFVLSPNPSSGDVVIDLAAGSTGQVNVQVLSGTGQLLMTEVFASLPSGPQRGRLSTHALPAGVYHVRVFVDGLSSTRRFVRL